MSSDQIKKAEFYKTFNLLTNLMAQVGSTVACFIFAWQQGSLGETIIRIFTFLTIHNRISQPDLQRLLIPGLKTGTRVLIFVFSSLGSVMADKNRAYGQQLGSARNDTEI